MAFVVVYDANVLYPSGVSWFLGVAADLGRAGAALPIRPDVD
jgi:hypothetical protein